MANLARYEFAARHHRRAEIGLIPAAMRGRGSMFESLRDYVPGDDPVDVAWKATARHDRLITRNYESERSQNVLVMLDCGRLMVPQVDRLSRLDYGINATLLLSYVAMKQGDYIGLLAFSDQLETYIPPVKGRAALGRMNKALYRLEPRLRESNYEQICKFLSLRHRKRSLIVILTDVIDKEASSVLLAYMARFGAITCRCVLLCEIWKWSAWLPPNPGNLPTALPRASLCNCCHDGRKPWSACASRAWTFLTLIRGS